MKNSQWVIGVLATASVLAGCATGATLGAGSAAPAEPDTTAGAGAPTFSVPLDQGIIEANSMNADGTAGSGCDVAEGAQLPDGIWYGNVEQWSDTNVSFDLWCMYHFDSPQFAAAAAVADPEGADVGYVTQDAGTAPVEVTLRAGAEFYPATYLADSDHGATSFVPLKYSTAMAGGFGEPVWVFVNGGAVSAVVVQYTP